MKTFKEYLIEDAISSKNKKHISPLILNLVKDVAKDSEFQYDESLSDDVNKNIDYILNNNDLFKRLLKMWKSDYEHDIKMEKDDNEDVDYLMPTYNAINDLLKKT